MAAQTHKKETATEVVEAGLIAGAHSKPKGRTQYEAREIRKTRLTTYQKKIAKRKEPNFFHERLQVRIVSEGMS